MAFPSDNLGQRGLDSGHIRRAVCGHQLDSQKEAESELISQENRENCASVYFQKGGSSPGLPPFLWENPF